MSTKSPALPADRNVAPVTGDEAAGIERRIADVEARTGVQLVAAVVPRADAYPEIPWRAFALGASIAAFIAVVLDVGRPDWLSAKALLVQALAILAGGAIAGVASLWLPRFARWFVGDARATVEVRQCAESLFLSRELFATPRRDAVLVLVSEFERRVVIVPDVYCRGRVTAQEWETVVAAMTPKLRAHRTGDAFLAGLDAIDALLAGKGFAPAEGTARNALADTLLRGEAP